MSLHRCICVRKSLYTFTEPHWVFVVFWPFISKSNVYHHFFSDGQWTVKNRFNTISAMCYTWPNSDAHLHALSWERSISWVSMLGNTQNTRTKDLSRRDTRPKFYDPLLQIHCFIKMQRWAPCLSVSFNQTMTGKCFLIVFSLIDAEYNA